ncbi:MAG: DNA mismatch repair protein MutS, partial [Thermoguttaceae bacterium]|nr:DNA mismatch repair protein MutS [Thermoguttaceae bacterium]
PADTRSPGESTAADENGPGESAKAPDGTCPTAIDGPAGIAWVELSTGQFHAAVLPWTQLIDQIGRIGPAEILLPESLKGILPAWLTEGMMISTRPDWVFSSARSLELLLAQFKVKTLEGFGFKLPREQRAIQAAGGILDYLQETQKQSLEHIESLLPYRTGGQLDIDEMSRRSLELVQTIRDGRRDGSLLSVIDFSLTSMGSRLLADWLTYPLTDVRQIQTRQDAVENLISRGDATDDMRQKLRCVCDLERISAKVVQRRAIPRDLVLINRTLITLPSIVEFLDQCSCSLLKTLQNNLDVLESLSNELTAALDPDGPLNYREGGFIRTGYHQQLDEYRELQSGGKRWLAEYQAQESQRTGISNLKVGYTSVFGYYIEVTRTNTDRIPEHYVRKQTLKNAERYITDELKVYEEKVLTSAEKALELEMQLFDGLLQKVLAVRAKLQRNAGVLAHLDALSGLAVLARTRGYVRPTVVDEPVLEIVEGRHPVLDLTEASGTFVPNDAFCDEKRGMIHLITGPNMAGKSTFIRQVALLVIMAQIGSFIPVRKATIGIADRIFARVGASDELTRGQSTFMVEMVETARILNGATLRSLVILDEIGRGTSTYDGISLAWSIVECLHEKIGCRTFFATHYHELTGLADTYEGISNLNVAVREWNDDIVFLHKIVEGAADRSYGIHVARLAGVPADVVARAKTILAELESTHVQAAQDAVRNVLQNVSSSRWNETDAPNEEHEFLRKKLKKKTASGTIQFSLFGPEDHPVIEELRGIDICTMTPMEALAMLERLKKLL